MARTDGNRVDNKALSARLDRLDIDRDSMAVMLNIFRVGMAFRNHTEQTILDRYGLSFSGFTVLWVLWVWGKKQFFELAEECGVSKGTLTGVINTLEKSGYIERKPHASDRRRLVVQLSRRGRNLMKRLFPDFNAVETRVTAGLSVKQKQELSAMLKTVLGDTLNA